MTSQPPPASPTSEQADRLQRHRAILDEMIDMGADLAAMAHAQAKAQAGSESPAIPLPDLIGAFDRATRAMRRCMALSRVLDHPVTTPDHAAARRAILRAVEDTIEERARPDQAEALRACPMGANLRLEATR